MKDGLRQTMAFLHGWAGLIPGWLLYAVFFTGTLTYYRQEITQWMHPELSGAVADPRAAEHAQAWLTNRAPDATLWRIDLPTARNPLTEVMWKGPTGGFDSQWLDPRTGGLLVARDTMGGDFLFYFHFDLNAPGSIGRWFVCFAAIALLAALISGVITHRRLFVDFFTFRPGKGRRTWLDAHNLTGVFALPYHAMIAFTGLVALASMFLPWAIQRAYSGDWTAYERELAGSPVTEVSGGRGDCPVSFAALLHRAEGAWGGRPAGRIVVEHPLASDCTIRIEQSDTQVLSYDRAWIQFSAAGKVIARYRGGGGAVATRGWLYGFHLARFSDGMTRALFFLSGVLGTAAIATGLVLWASKRRPRDSTTILLADRINVAVITGLPLAVSALFLANRVLPVWLPDRAEWEGTAFFLTWLAALLHVSIAAPGSAWRCQLALCGAMCLLSPLVIAFVPGTGLMAWIANGDSVRMGVDVALLAAGGGALHFAFKRP
jgi:uncharacterized iron-regulated membrane protein